MGGVPVGIPCVGALVIDEGGRLLLVRRGRPPGAGLWSVPGGRVEPGESEAEAVRREVREETGLDVAVGTLVGRVRRPGLAAGTSYDIGDYRCSVLAGDLRAGDDAAEVCWAGPDDLRRLPLVEGLAAVLVAWGVLPAATFP